MSTFTPGQKVFWFRPGSNGRGRDYWTNRVKVPATFLGTSKTGNKLRILTEGSETPRLVTADWVEAPRPGGGR